jgi:Domain of unknown function (DUF4194)
VSDLSPVVIQILKGPVYRDTHEVVWSALLKQRAQVSDFVAVLGLRVEIDESDGYAYLRSRDDDAAAELPRLVSRHKLPYHVSLLLALLRKRLVEFDAASTEGQLVLTTGELVEMMRMYLPDATNEVKVQREIETAITRAQDLGFLRQLRGSADEFEVRRILRAFVDGQFLADLHTQLDDYLATLRDTEVRP